MKEVMLGIMMDGLRVSQTITTSAYEIRNKYTYELVGTGPSSSSRVQDDYVHANWGWGGSQNGYYVSGIFFTSTGPIKPSNDNQNYRSLQRTIDDNSGIAGYFQYNLEIFTDIRR